MSKFENIETGDIIVTWSVFAPDFKEDEDNDVPPYKRKSSNNCVYLNHCVVMENNKNFLEVLTKDKEIILVFDNFALVTNPSHLRKLKRRVLRFISKRTDPKNQYHPPNYTYYSKAELKAKTEKFFKLYGV